MIVLDDLVLEWYTIEQGSVCIGQSIRDLQVRTESGASIVSIIAPNRINRINPEADTILNEGATLIFIGGSIYIVLNFVVGVAYAI
jgi:TrkA domain protein